MTWPTTIDVPAKSWLVEDGAHERTKAEATVYQSELCTIDGDKQHR